jgi:hypothetical protein
MRSSIQEIVMNRSKKNARSAIRPLALCAAATSVLSLAIGTAGIAHASDVDVHVWFTTVPTIYVEAHDGAYSMLSPEKHNGQYIQFTADLEILGGQDRIRRWDIAPRMKAFGKTWGWSFGTSRPPEQGWGVVGQSYGFGDRPKTVRQNISMLVSPRSRAKAKTIRKFSASIAPYRPQRRSDRR